MKYYENNTYENILSADLSVYEESEVYQYQITKEHVTIFKDLFSDRNEARKFINMKEEEDMLLVAERLKKDREREMRRCKREGKIEGKKELQIVKNMLKEGFDIDIINKITGHDKEKLRT